MVIFRPESAETELFLLPVLLAAMVTTESSRTSSVLFSWAVINCDLLTVKVDLTSLLWVKSICVNMDWSSFIRSLSRFLCVIRSSLWTRPHTVSSIIMAHFEMSFSEVILNGIEPLEGSLFVVLWIIELLHSFLSQLSVEYCLLLVFFHFDRRGSVWVWTVRPETWISFSELEVVGGESDRLLCKCLLDHFTV